MNTAAGTTRRLFVAVPLPGSALPFVLEAQRALPRAQDMRLLKPEQLHFTLAFIGEVDEERTTAARAVVEGLPRDSGGEAWLDGTLLLPNAKRARVIALRVVDEAAVFSRLFGLVMGGLEANGVTTREKRPFRAHLTIARMRRPGLLGLTHDCGRSRFGVESVCLYESKLRRDGAEYTVVARTELKMAEGRDTT